MSLLCVYIICHILFSFLLDGHHKLIRWRFVTHGGIDGYSRMITYLKCSTNNKARTVYGLFTEAVRTFGLPSRVRSDQGLENILVARHMLEHHGTERRSIITGCSTHNQRIERLWRDLHRCATQLFYRLFYHLENHDLLDPTNDIHLYVLHFVFLPRINRALVGFCESWNHHSLRTEHYRSPHQLFVFGSLRLQHSGLLALDFFERVEDEYGVEEAGYAAREQGEGVPVPRNSFQLTEVHHTELRRLIDPDTPSNS